MIKRLWQEPCSCGGPCGFKTVTVVLTQEGSREPGLMKADKRIAKYFFKWV